MTVLTTDDYYDFHDVLTRRAPWNIVVGARGLGKTYAAKMMAVKRFLKNGEQFIYLRRTEEEQKIKGTFFDDISQNFKNCLFRVNGSVAEIHTENMPAKTYEPIGFFVSLVQAGYRKSVAYPNVRTIIFDEIFPDNGRYLQDEPTRLANFYSTVDRWRDKCRLLMLSNATDDANPYFSRFDINPADQRDKRQPIKTYCNGYVAVEFADYRGFSAKVSQTRFGRFIQQIDPEYAKYAIDNIAKNTGKQLVAALPDNATRVCMIHDAIYGDISLHAHLDQSGTSIVTVSRRVYDHIPQYTTDMHAVTETRQYCDKTSPVLKLLLNAYKTGRLRFETERTRSDMLQMIGGMM